MITGLIAIVILAVFARPFERWEGSMARRANTSKVPIDLIFVLDMMSIPLMMVVAVGLPSAVLMTPPGKVGDALGFKDLLSEGLFWLASGVLAYLIINSARILMAYAWSFFGFAGFRLYTWGGLKALPAFLLIPFIVLAPITKVVNLVLANSLAGVLSGFDGKVNYAPILILTTIFNVAIVINGLMRAPSEGQFMLQYTLSLAEAVKDANISIVWRNAANMIPTELPMLDNGVGDYAEVPMPDARALLGGASRKAKVLARYLRKNPAGEYALAPEAAELVEAQNGIVNIKKL